MATIQVRNVPDQVHRAYQRRAEAAGMSLQEYILAELNRNALLRTPTEIVADVERRMATNPGGFTSGTSAGAVRSDRLSH